MRFGPWEIALILIIILIVFGVGKLPQVGESLGKGLRAFKKASHLEDDESKAEKTDAKTDVKKSS